MPLDPTASAERADRTAADDPTSGLRLTLRGWGLLVAGALAIAAGEFFGILPLRYAGLALAALPVIVVLARLALPPRLDLERTVFPTTLAAGDRMRVVAELRNRSILGVEAGAYSDVVTGAAARSVGGVLPAVASRLHPREGRRRRRIAYGMTGLRRGIQHVGPLYFESADGLGITRRVVRIGEPVAVEVWPTLHDIDRLEVPELRTGAEIDVSLGRSGEADDVVTREYRRGDAMRRVHWRASARAGELRVRQEEHHSEVVALVVLDTRPIAPGLFDPDFELSVSLAASVVQRLHELGYDTEANATHPVDDVEGMRLAGLRTSAGSPLGAVMRRFMLIDGAEHEQLAEADAVETILARALRVGSGPLVYVGRVGDAAVAGSALSAPGTAAPGPASAAVLELAAAGSPPIAVLVGSGEAATAEARRFAAAGWEVVTLDGRARDPWASVERIGAAA